MNRYVGTAYLLNRAELPVLKIMLLAYGLAPKQFLVLCSLQNVHGQSSAELAALDCGVVLA